MKPTLWIPFFLHTYGQRLPSYDFRVPRWRPGRYVRERVRFPVRRCHVGGTTAVTSENVGVSWLFEKMQMGKPMMAKVVLFVFEGLNAGGRWKVRPKQSSTYNYVVKLLYIGLFKISPGIPVPEIRFCFSHIVISPAQPSEGVKRGFWAQHLESKLNLSTVWRKVLYLNDTWNKLHSYCRKFFLKAGTKQMQ